VGYKPTLEEASVRLFRVVLLPAEGFPTKPIRGSRPIAWQSGKTAQKVRFQGSAPFYKRAKAVGGEKQQYPTEIT
jgi:hypothetical protein